MVNLKRVCMCWYVCAYKVLNEKELTSPHLYIFWEFRGQSVTKVQKELGT